MTLRLRRIVLLVGACLAAVLLLAAYVWRGDIHQAFLDPGRPFQTYRPPPAPDYARPESWALQPVGTVATAPADVFFVHPTTYDGGDHWTGPTEDPEAARLFTQVMAPNYAGPFRSVGRIFAPRYRQASLYTQLTTRDDAREARAFAYGDVAKAFDFYLRNYNQGRPLFLVGVEQGGFLAKRLAAEAPAQVRDRLIAVYLIETAIPEAAAPLPPCRARGQVGCVLSWISAAAGEPDTLKDRLRHSMYWDGDRARLLGDRQPLCVNPVTGAQDGSASARAHLGGANASELDWDARPAFLTHQVSTACRAGVLHVSRPRSASLRLGGSWVEQARAKPFNLFYADIEADAQARLAAWLARQGGSNRAQPAS